MGTKIKNSMPGQRPLAIGSVAPGVAVFLMLMLPLDRSLAHGGFGGGGMSGFSGRAGGGAFGGGGGMGADAQRFGGNGIGGGHFGGGGLGSVRGSGDEGGVGRDWADRAGETRNPNYATDRERYQQDLDHREMHEGEYARYDYNHYYNHYYGGFYGGSYMYYGGTWGGFYSGMMMGEMSGMMMGASMATLPAQYSTVMVSGQPYYYSNGAYLTQQSGQTGYTLVPPPPGAVVTYLPSNCAPLYLGTQAFDDCGGAFYQRVPGGYQVTLPPPGLEVGSLPSGAVAHQVRNIQYFEFGGVWYQPFYGGSDVIYRVVQNPNASDQK